MKIYAIGDLHLSFGEMIEKPMDIFGSLWVGHADKLYKNWTEKVSAEDLVIVCGDISWGMRLEEAMADFEWIRGLPGRKLLFKGNHDLWWQSVSKLNQLYEDDNLVFMQNNAYLTEIDSKSIAICGTRGWICPGTEGFKEHDDKIYRRELLRLRCSLEEAKRAGASELIGVLHYPPTNDKLQISGFTELFSEFGVKTCVYGHLHGKEAFKKGINGVLNGVEYKLVSLDYLEGNPEEVIL